MSGSAWWSIVGETGDEDERMSRRKRNVVVVTMRDRSDAFFVVAGASIEWDDGWDMSPPRCYAIDIIWAPNNVVTTPP